VCAFLSATPAHAQPAAAHRPATRKAPYTNLWVLGMEVTQATQTWLAVNRETQSLMPIAVDYSPEGVPLVRGKRTVVRVYPGLEGPLQTMTGVEAALTCQTTVTTPCPGPAAIAPVAPILVDQAYGNDLDALQRDASRTWNFVLPDAWIEQPAPLRLTATITASKDQPECYPCHDKANSLTLSGLAFQATALLRLNVVYGCVRRAAGDPQSVCDTSPLGIHVDLLTGDDSLVMRTFPVAERDIQVTLQSPVALSAYGDLERDDGVMTRERMYAFHRLICDAAHPASDGRALPLNEITIGLVPGPAPSVLGLGSDHCIVVAVDADSLPRAAEVLAEELGHALGRPHAGCDVHPPGESAPCDPIYQQFPCPHGGICVPGFDTIHLSVIDPGNPPAGEHAHDFMSYGKGAQWISPYTYRHLYDTLHALLPAE
jgi:hypothetical protein